MIFAPRCPLGWLLRLVALSIVIAGSGYFLETQVLGRDIEDSFKVYAAVVGTIASPFLILAMILVKHMEQLQIALERAATTDSLTGLLNRSAFTKNVALAGDGVLLIVDLDHFKDINDRYGHAVGDAVLRAVADQLRLNTRMEDILARIGGEEFGIFLVGMDSQEVDRVGERLCTGFVLCNSDVRLPVKVTMSAGAAFSGMARTWTELFTNADQALYRAKRSGRAQLAFWQPAATSRY